MQRDGSPVIFGLVGCGIGCGSGILAWFVSMLFMGAGHGTYLPAKLFFPYTMAATHWSEQITLEGVVIGFLSFAIYGIIVGVSFPTGHGWKAAIGVTALHAVAVLIAFAMTDSAF